MDRYDCIVIGSGPGGYVAAIRAAHLGARVALIECREVGGTCLNRGCIPTKALIASASLWSKLQMASALGIEIDGCRINYSVMLKRKEQVVEEIRTKLTHLIESSGIDIIQGYGRFAPSESEMLKVIKVYASDDRQRALRTLQSPKVIVATGSRPMNIPSFPFDGKKVHSSTSILTISSIPKKIAIIGGGYIGCEFASMFSALGSDVVVIEAMDRLLRSECTRSSELVTAALEDRGVKILTHTRVANIDTSKEDGIGVELEERGTLDAQCALVCVGRSLNSENLGLEHVGLSLDAKGAIPVNDQMETLRDGVYAIGDVTGKWLLAHTASHQGLVAANNAQGRFSRMHYDAIPSVIFTSPEVASVGMTLDKARERGLRAKVSQFPFAALGKAQAAMESEGFAQIVLEEGSERILGAQVVGHEAGALIAEMALAIENELTLECITQTIHAHPTISEVWLEAALVAQDLPLHLPKSSPRPPLKSLKVQ